MVNGRNEESLPVLLLFDEEYPLTHEKLVYMRYAVRAYLNRPLQCLKCKKFVHMASVCRRNKYVVEESVDTQYCNCGGNHVPGMPCRGEGGRSSKNPGFPPGLLYRGRQMAEGASAN